MDGLSGQAAGHVRRRRGGPGLLRCLTPMIDVTFLLLLFFLLTTTFRQPEGSLPGSLPGGVVRPQVARPIEVGLRPAGEGVIYELLGVAGSVPCPHELYEKLLSRQRLYGTKEVPVVIRPRADVRWQYVVEAFNQAVRARFKEISIASSG